METDILIIGAGVSGLSAAYHLELLKKNYLLVEAQSAPGGLCRSVEQDGFLFDYSGHVVHTKDKYVSSLIQHLLGKNINLVKRNAWVFLQGAYVPFPFQTNLFYLKANIVKECIDALMTASKTKKNNENFKAWALSTYGAGICKYFMFPYNQKLWQTKPEDLSTEWVNTFVPKSNMQDIVKGAYFETPRNIGYNTCFFYPKEGAIAALPNALAKKVKNLRLNTRITRVDAENKTAFTAAGQEIKYKKLINTTPLKTFLSAASLFKEEAARLKNTTVNVLCLGVNRLIKDISWVYFPEDKYQFYRAGVQSSFSAKTAPQGASALYVEFSGKKPSVEKCVAQLKECGLLEDNDKILTRLWLEIPVAYAVYDKHREQLSSLLIKELKKRQIYSLGRYGAWEYSFIEKNILDAKALAAKM